MGRGGFGPWKEPHLGGEAEQADGGGRCGHQPLLGCAVGRAEVEHRVDRAVELPLPQR